MQMGSSRIRCSWPADVAKALRLVVDCLAMAEGAALKLPEVVARQEADHAEHVVVVAAKRAAMVKICIGSIDMFQFMYNCIYHHDINWIDWTLQHQHFQLLRNRKGSQDFWSCWQHA